MSWTSLCRNNRSSFKQSIYESIHLVNQSHWEEIVGDKNLYLSIPYLTAIEESLRASIQFRYIQFYDEDYRPIGIAVTQILNFLPKRIESNKLPFGIEKKIQNSLIKNSGIKVMICGNAFTCGEHGFLFKKEVDTKKAYSNLANGLYRLIRSENTNEEASAVLFKEFWPTSFSQSDYFKSFDFEDFMVDVNMVLDIERNWKSFDDYLDHMTTKYRTRVKRVYKKSENIISKNLSVDEICFYQNNFEELYNSVINNAEFSFGKLNAHSFVNLKEQLGDKYIVTGYFFKEKLVGFSSAYRLANVLDAGYIGLDYTVNNNYMLYPRMLYDLVNIAIQQNVEELRLGRTAEEMKSRLGAKPVNMKLYVKHKNTFSNKLIKPIISSIVPSEFEIRSPFKESVLL